VTWIVQTAAAAAAAVVAVRTQSVAPAETVVVAWHRTGFQSNSAQVVESLASARGRLQKAYHCSVAVAAGVGSFGFAGRRKSDGGMQERRTVVEGCSYYSFLSQELR